MKKAPENRGLGVEPRRPPRRRRLLLFLRSSLLLRGGLLGCALHRLILPNIRFCDFGKSQCDSYIRWFAVKVKKKMNSRPVSTPFGLHARRRWKRNCSRCNLDPPCASYSKLGAPDGDRASR